MKRRILSMLLVLAMVLSVVPAVSAAEVASGTCGENLIWSVDEAAGTLTISGTGDMDNFDLDRTPWFSLEKSIKTVKIDDGVTGIGDYAFTYFVNMTSVMIPDSVTRIGVAAFSCCDRLTSVTIPKGVASVAVGAFSNSVNLTEIKFLGNAPSIAQRSLDGLTATVYYPSGNATWTDEVMQDYGGTITWTAYNAPVIFTDVPEGVYYTEPVAWAVANGITNGMGDGTFAPASACNRAQVVTFLWRAEGSPAPKSNVNPFVDVPEGAFYHDAALWAYEQGITSGADATHFNPNGGCSRAQVVTFLWRAEGSPAPKSQVNSFVDVPEDAFYADAVLWAVEQRITNGVDDTHFAPNTICDRAQIVTFLHRAYT